MSDGEIKLLLRDFERRRMDVDEVAAYLHTIRKELAYFEGCAGWIPKKQNSTSARPWISVF